MRRRSDRRPYTSWEIPAELVAELVAHAADEGAILRPVTAPGSLSRFGAAVTAAAAAHAALPGYTTETRLWTARCASDDGIPAANLLSRPTTTNRAFPAGTVDGPGPGRVDGALVTVLGTASDDRLSQLRAGEALSAVVLHATVAGLATCPLTEVLEVQEARAVLRDDVLSGSLSPQLVLRIGWAPAGTIPATPRRPVDSVLDSTTGGER